MLTGLTVMTLENQALETSLLNRLSINDESVKVRATLLEDGKRLPDVTRAYVRIEEVKTKKESWKLRERAYIYIDNLDSELQSGDELQFSAKPRSVRARISGSKRSYRAMERRGVSATFSLDGERISEITSNKKGLDNIRKRVINGISKSVNRPYSGILQGILIGDTSAIDEVDMRTYERAGLIHLFAVSGLNVTLNIAFVFLVCRILNLRPGITLLISFASLAFFVWLVGGGASVNRAALMSSVLLVSWFFGRRGDILSAVSISALIILVINPKEIFSVSFQLSYGALLGILLITPVLIGLFDEEIRGLVIPAAVALGAQLAVQPFLAYYFNQLSIISVLSNMVIVPPVAAITAIGFMATLISLINLTVAGIIYKALIPVLGYIFYGSKLLASIPGASTRIATPGIISILTYIIIIGVVLFIISRFPKRLGFGSFIIIILSMISIGIWSQMPLSFNNDLRVTFIDVGQGDSTLIQSPRGKTILIDGGPDFKKLDKKLIERNIKKIDILIVSHGHLDHIKGLIDLVKEYPVGTILDSSYSNSSTYYQELIDNTKSMGIEYMKVASGDNFTIDEVSFDILLPADDFYSDEGSEINNASLVAMVSYKDFDILFPGDVEIDSIDDLIEDYPNDIDAEVLKVSHHGSRNGTTEDLIEAVLPGDAVISVGSENSFGHPHMSTLKILRSSGVRLWRTDDDSSVMVTSDGKDYKIWSLQ